MVRTARFVKQFNGYKGTRLTLADFFTVDEILKFKQNYLEMNGRPIRAVGANAEGSFGDDDEVEGHANIVYIRYSRLSNTGK